MKMCCTFLFLLVTASTTFAETARQLSIREVAQKLLEFDRTMDAFVRGDPRKMAVEAINELIANHNHWIESQNTFMETEQSRLDSSAVPLDEMRKQVEQADRTLAQTAKPGTNQQAEKYNELIMERNKLVGEYNRMGELHQNHVAQYNNQVAELKRNIESKEQSVQASKSKYQRRIDQHDSWFKAKKDELFFLKVNRLYADVIEMARESGNMSSMAPQGLQQARNTLRSLRSELGEYARTKQNEAEYGLLVVPVVINGRETIHMLLDTGASRMTITDEVLRILDLTDKIGETTEMTVAGGLTVVGPQVDLEQVSLYGATAFDVPAAVIPNSDLGVDGLLGRSFLKRFILHIDDSKSPRIELMERR